MSAGSLWRHLKIPGLVGILGCLKPISSPSPQTCNTYNYARSRILAATGSQVSTPALKRTILAEGTDDIVGTLGQDRSQIAVASFCDA